MSRFKQFAIGAALAAFAFGSVVRASDNAAMDSDVRRLDDGWAHIRYQVNDRSQQYAQLDKLAEQAAQVSARYPGQADPLLWQGIVVSEEAARATVFKQLGLASSAREILERARAISPRNTGVLMTLGVLYYKVPGFPIGFGSTQKARSLLQTALSQDPNGLDANFFYADFLSAQGDKANARAYLARALKAAPNPARPVWDAGRRAEARDLLAKLG
jgi:tetratricopeptide (TPR) repeat protein